MKLIYQNKETGQSVYEGDMSEYDLSWEQAAQMLFEGKEIVVLDYDDFDDEWGVTFAEPFVMTPEHISPQHRDTVEDVKLWIRHYYKFSSDLTLAS